MSDDAYADVDRLARDVRDALCEDVPATGYDRDVVEKFDRLLAAVRHEHGERISGEAVDKIQRYMATRGRMGGEYDDGVDNGLSTAAAILLGADIARDLDRALKAREDEGEA